VQLLNNDFSYLKWIQIIARPQKVMNATAVGMHICHTHFFEENRMHLICVLGSQFHTYDRLMSVISQDIAQNVQKRFINFYYTHEGRHEGFTRTTITMKTQLHLHLPQASDWLIASSELLVVSEVLHSEILL
jgi:hypothetical protein